MANNEIHGLVLNGQVLFDISELADPSKITNFTSGLQVKGVPVATSDDLKSVEASAWRPLTADFDTKYFPQANNYVFEAFIKVDNGKAQFAGFLSDHSMETYPFGTYIKLATLPTGIAFTKDVNLGGNSQGILTQPYNDKTYTASVYGSITGHSSDNSIGVTFSKGGIPCDVDWYPSTTYGASVTTPIWIINGSISDINIS